MSTRKRSESRALHRPAAISIELPRGDYEPVVGILAQRALRLAGLPEGQGKELTRAVVEMTAMAGRESSVRLHFTIDKSCIVVALRPGAVSGEELLRTWEKKRAHRLMDEARLQGEPGARELVLVKSL